VFEDNGETQQQEVGETYIMMSFIICFLSPTSLGQSKDKMGGIHTMEEGGKKFIDL
jgi:hypothetical protein